MNSLYQLPSSRLESIENYLRYGKPMGGFLTAVFSNDLRGAIASASESDKPLVEQYIKYLYWELPSQCHGSKKKVRSWIESMWTEEAQSILHGGIND